MCMCVEVDISNGTNGRFSPWISDEGNTSLSSVSKEMESTTYRHSFECPGSSDKS